MNRDAISKFSGTTTWHVLPGGQNESIRSGDLVLKPVHEREKYLWLAECLGKIDFDDLQIAIPVRSRDGNYIEHSIGATRYYEASFVPGKLEAKLATCRKLNRAISHISKPADFDRWSNPWTTAQSVAWSSIPDSDMQLPDEIGMLLSLRKEIKMQAQLIHVDLAGNILFDACGNPVVIDFTPAFYPKEYAEVILLIDSIAWYGEPIDILNLLKVEDDLKKQLILRGLIFRVSVPLFLKNLSGSDNYQKNFSGYKILIEKVLSDN